MREELVEEIISLVEEYINELDDETVDNAYAEREKRYKEATDKAANAPEDEKIEAKEAAAKEHKKLEKHKELAARRASRQATALAKFKEMLLNRAPQTATQTQQAGSDHSNAEIAQGLRNKYEKVLKIPANVSKK